MDDGRQANTKPEPWSRWGAKWIDTALFALAFSVVLGFIGYDWYGEYAELGFLALMAFTYPFWDAFVLAFSGGSPGRAVFRFSVRAKGTTSAPKLGTAISRAWGAWAGGCALGIPFIGIFTGLASKSDLEKNGESAWDRECQTEVVHNGATWFSWLVLLAVFVGVVALNLYARENYYY